MFRLLRIGFLSLLSLSFAGWVLHWYGTKPVILSEKSQQYETNAVPIEGTFHLFDIQGHRRTDKEFRGKYMVVYFGYTYCPDICPMALAHISEALAELKADRGQFVPIFITIDPERDTKESLKSYAQHFDPNFIMLTGAQEQIDQAKKSYRVYSARVEDPKNSDYLMDHSTMIYIMDRQGKFLKSVPHTTSGQDLARAFLELLNLEHKKA